jgi:hypothetical protein
MAVMHITYKPNPDTADAAYEGFSQILKNYRSIRLSQSNWAIHIEEPPKAVWQKLKRYIYPDEYLVMFPLDASLWTSQDRKALQFILSRP